MNARYETRQILVKVTIPLLLFLFSIGLSACQRPSKVEITPTVNLEINQPQLEATATQEPAGPTPTTLPLAALVNGSGILLEDLNNEILRYMLANPGTSAEDSFDHALQSQIDQMLLSQSAQESGFVANDEEVSTRITALIQELGGESLFDQWLGDNFYTSDSFERTLKTAIEAQYQTNLIANQIPNEMDQVELRQILVYDQATADAIESALENGTSFDWLAEQYHPLTKGYLSWAPRGYLSLPEIEEVAFDLAQDTVSDAIKTDYGYHFILVLNHEIHPLSANAKQTLQLNALEAWMVEQRNSAEIEIIATVQ